MEKQREIGIDVLKIIACIGVVLLHTIGFKASKYNNLIYYLGTISVPIFFMANGYFILNKEEITLKYLIKKISRILFIVISWNIIYSLIVFIFTGYIDNIIIQIIKSTLQKGNIIWFCFFGTLIILYIFTPILHKTLHNKKINKKFLIIMISICEIIYIINVCLGYKEYKIIRQVIPQTLRLWTWITYYYLGGYLKNNLKWKKKYGVILIGISIFCIFYEMIISNNIIHDLFAENFYDNIFIMTWVTLLFSFIKNMSFKEKYRNLIINISSLTLGIYIIHEFIVKYISNFYDSKNGVYNIGVFIITLVMSYLISYIIKKITYLNKLIT